MTLRRVLPLPFTSLGILALWMALATKPSLGNFVLGGVLALAIPLLSRRFWPQAPRVARPFAAVLFFLKVVYDILVANWQVARIVLGPLRNVKPDFVTVPIDLDDAFVATLLGSVISLTPGTVSIDIDMARRELLVHALDVTDKLQFVRDIKTRYEAPLKEIFAC